MTITAGTEQGQGAGAPAAVVESPAPDPRSGAGPEVRAAGPRGGASRPRPSHTGARLIRLVADRYWADLPGRLRLARAACVLLATGLLILLAVAATGAAAIWDETARREAPRTISATQLNLALNDMDAQAANILLSSGDSGTGKGRLDESYTKANGFYRGAQETISRSLRTLGAASEGDSATEATVVTLTDDFAHYQELIGRALENDSRPGGKDAAREDYRSATDLLTDRLLPEARKLVDANNTVYERQYDAARGDLDAQRTAEAVVGVLLIAALVLLQIHLTRRFNRVFNPALVAATLCAVVAVGCGAQLLSTTDDRMKVARRDSFDSVIALSRSKAIGYDANADESRYLLDPERRATYERYFLDKSHQLYGIVGAGHDTYDGKLDETWSAYRKDHDDKRFTGEYRRELDNITFAGERDAAEKTVEAYAVYQRDDRTLRRLVADGKTQEATVFCVGWAPDTSNAHFGEWMKALDEVTAINQRHFDLAVRDGRGALTTQVPLAVAALLLAAGLTALGLRRRLAEFR
ncbi:hypothetical protein OHS33_03805 [Streptomyces sp. NBC_00536]|uniref:hypothetical protein n=1 Tax=Streptomyces sp. NBC_00536 TaxID=2975769 RepID=UPI002E812EF4|nr:hypothetical protein [Streptomyces sp. NBC_00536]WUC77539.1 hypothetical protein OHS33_03805 [Streptomyces sp. NBC_00536]